MSIWDAANRVEELGFKAHSIKCVVDVIAESISTNSESGALWAVSEMLEHLSDQLDDQARALIELNKAQGKKK